MTETEDFLQVVVSDGGWSGLLHCTMRKNGWVGVWEGIGRFGDQRLRIDYQWEMRRTCGYLYRGRRV